MRPSLLAHLLLLRISCLRTAHIHALWPAPQDFQHGQSVVWLDSRVELVYQPLQQSLQPVQWLWDRFRELPLLPYNTSQRKGAPDPGTLLRDAFDRMKYHVLNENFIPRKFYPNLDFEPDGKSTHRRFVKTIFIRQVKAVALSSRHQTASPEAYSVQLEADGRTSIEITSSQGGLHALETFSQLFFTHSKTSGEVYSPYAPVSIFDSPDFEHRGLNLDISRNWIPPGDVMRTVEAMAATKLNQLHIHAADAQSWPLEIPAFPELAARGAYSPSQIWTTADLEAVQRHGLAHGVEVFLEIDLPGHTRSIGYAYPDMIVAADKEPWADYALEPPAGQLRLNSSEVTHFLTTLLNDLLSRSSRWSSKFHLGGDELNTHVYTLDPTVKSSSPTVLQPLVQTFMDHVLSILQSHGVRPIMWEEMALDWNLTLPGSVMVQTWRSASALNAVLAKGHKTLFGSNDHWYLDCGLGWFLDPSLENPNLSDPERRIKPPYLDSCSPYKNWRQIYSYDPLDGVLPEHRHLVAGGEVHMWGELTDSVSLDSTLWPRVAAAAEVMWSRTSRMPEEETTRRLAEFRERLVARGVRAGMIQMEWCLRHRGGCTL